MKAVTAPAELLAAANMAKDITSEAIDVLQVDVLGIQVDYEGDAPAGVLTVEGSVNGTTYVPLYFTVNGSNVNSLTIPTATSPILCDMNIGSLAKVRVMFVADGDAATLTLGDLTFTAVLKGTDGDSITVALVNTVLAGHETVDVVGDAITINMEDSVSTAQQIADALNASADALALISVAIAAGQEGVAQDAVAATNLEDGAGTPDGTMDAAITKKRIGD